MRRGGRTPTAAWEREFNRRLGRNIAAKRQANGLTAAALARLVGVDQARVWRWEHGIFGLGVARLQLVADALGVTSTSLLPPLADLAIDDAPPAVHGKTRLLHDSALEGAAPGSAGA